MGVGAGVELSLFVCYVALSGVIWIDVSLLAEDKAAFHL
jgi:hypothetical protein